MTIFTVRNWLRDLTQGKSMPKKKTKKTGKTKKRGGY